MSFGVHELRLSNFRNYDALEQTLAPGFTILAGQNAQGKTNFLEAIYWLSTTRLLRGQRDSEVIRAGTTRCQLSATLITGTTIAASLEQGARKKFHLNGAPLARASDVMGRLPCVSITLYDLELVRGEPSDRRLFLDLEISSLYPAYLQHFSLYKRALEQRNALLKLAQERFIDSISFETWEEQLHEHGTAMRQYRAQYLTDLAPYATRYHREMASQDEELRIEYNSKDSGELLSLYAENRGQEIQRGSTQFGPHRDDFLISINGFESRLFGSQGQQRTAVIAIKLATLERATEVLSSPPILLLDDILSDLDPVRRAKLCQVVAKRAGQAILTCTEATAAGEEILDRAQVLKVDNGTVSPL